MLRALWAVHPGRVLAAFIAAWQGLHSRLAWLLVAMETAADFATVNYFAVPTLTTAVYDNLLGYGNLTAAAKLSAIILLVVFSLIGFERLPAVNSSYSKTIAHPSQ